MGYGSTILIIFVFVNMLVFLGAYAMNNLAITPPLISTLGNLASGNYNGLIPNLTVANNCGLFGACTNLYIMIGLIIVGIIAMSVLTGSNYLTTGGGFGVMHVPMLIGLFIFGSFALIPNFSAMGFPSLLSTPSLPISELLYAIFGLMLLVGIYGIIRGE